jgi:hypothetical protein
VLSNTQLQNQFNSKDRDFVEVAYTMKHLKEISIKCSALLKKCFGVNLLDILIQAYCSSWKRFSLTQQIVLDDFRFTRSKKIHKNIAINLFLQQNKFLWPVTNFVSLTTPVKFCNDWEWQIEMVCRCVVVKDLKMTFIHAVYLLFDNAQIVYYKCI